MCCCLSFQLRLLYQNVSSCCRTQISGLLWFVPQQTTASPICCIHAHYCGLCNHNVIFTLIEKQRIDKMLAFQQNARTNVSVSVWCFAFSFVRQSIKVLNKLESKSNVFARQKCCLPYSSLTCCILILCHVYLLSKAASFVHSLSNQTSCRPYCCAQMQAHWPVTLLGTPC